jgi:hypothetical protein
VLLIASRSALGLECEPETIIGGLNDISDDKATAIAVGPDGTAWLLWMATDPVDYDEEIYYSINTGAGWSAPDTLHGHNSSADRFPEISVGEDGVACAIWYRAQANGQRLWCSFWRDEQWSTPEIICGDAARYDDYDVYAKSADDIWVATDRHTNLNNGRIILTYHWDGFTWDGPRRIIVSGRSSSMPEFDVAPDGTPWLAWGAYLYDDNQEQIMVSSWADTGWAAPEVVNDDLNNLGWAHIVFDGDTPMVIWTGNIAGSFDVEYSRFDEGAWSPSASISLSDTPEDPYAVDGVTSCARAADGSIVAVWLAYNEYDWFNTGIFVSRWTGSGWTPEQRVTDDGPYKHLGTATAGLGPDGTLWVAWECYEEIEPPWTTDIRGTRCSMTTPVDFALGQAAMEHGSVRISWYAGGQAGYGPFYVLRAAVDSLAFVPATPLDGAPRLNNKPVTDAPHEWLDPDPPDALLAYWVEWAADGASEYLGPLIVDARDTEEVTRPRLLLATPNPSRGGALFGYEIDCDASVSVAIYSTAGRCVRVLRAPYRRSGRYNGDQALVWDGTDNSGHRVASGVYLARLRVDGRIVPGEQAAVTVVR